MPLNDRQIKNAKPAETGKKTKLFDGGGLYLEVTPAGGKVFRLKYRIDGKEKTLTIGKYPTVSLVGRSPPSCRKRPPLACIGARPQRSQATGKTRTASRHPKYL